MEAGCITHLMDTERQERSTVYMEVNMELLMKILSGLDLNDDKMRILHTRNFIASSIYSTSASVTAHSADFDVY